jgi:DNA-binding FadR family transcriptional regulator
VDSIRRQIHAGLLLPEERLPAERQLSDRFGISRVTLREALRVLEESQYIYVRRGAQGGPFVSDADRLSVLALRRISRAPAAAMRVTEYLTITQTAAARYAAERRNPADLKRLREALSLMHEASTGPLRKQSETLFLLAVADASRNPLLARGIEDALADLFLPYPGAAASDGDPRGIYATLLGAIESEDAQRAEAAMSELNAHLWGAIREITRSAA